MAWTSKTESKRNEYGEVVKVSGKTTINNSYFSIGVIASAAKDEEGNPEKVIVRKTRVGLKQQGTYRDGSPDMEYNYITTEEPITASDIQGGIEAYAKENFKNIFEERMDRDIREQKKLEEKIADEKRKREGNYTAEEQIRILKTKDHGAEESKRAAAERARSSIAETRESTQGQKDSHWDAVGEEVADDARLGYR